MFSDPRPSRFAGQPTPCRLIGPSVCCSCIPLLSLALHKMIRQVAQVIAILAWRSRRECFPLVLQLLMELPVLLPRRDYLLLRPDESMYPNLRELRLLVGTWRLGRSLHRRGLLGEAAATICTAQCVHPSIRAVLRYFQHFVACGP